MLYLTEASLCTCQAINQCVGGPTQKLLSKSRLFTSPDDHNTLMVAAGDESSSSVSYIFCDYHKLEKIPKKRSKENYIILRGDMGL